MPVARQPDGIAITPNGNEAWVGSNRDSPRVGPSIRNRRSRPRCCELGLPTGLMARPMERPSSSPIHHDGVDHRSASRKARFTIDVPKDRSWRPTAEVSRLAVARGLAISPDSRRPFVTAPGLQPDGDDLTWAAGRSALGADGDVVGWHRVFALVLRPK
jgi:hypothetical protein